MRTKRLTGFVLLIVSLPACKTLPPTEGVQPGEDAYMAQEHAGRPPFQTGLALSGGDQKSAPFAMGVLAALEESGTLRDIDIVSTVSGGSYAALFYYTRAAEVFRAGDYTISDAFQDCLPASRACDFSSSFPRKRHIGGLCPNSNPLWNYWPTTANDDPLRFASQIRGSQALFGSGFSYRRTADPLEKSISIAQISGWIALNSLVIPVHFVTNGLFDWNADTAPGKWAYNRGIDRAYGATASNDPQKPNGRSEGMLSAVYSLSFKELRSDYERPIDPHCSSEARMPCKLPLWVIATTSGRSDNFLLLMSPATFTGVENTFEFSPYLYGSGAYGYAAWTVDGSSTREPVLTVARAVGASGAFFDSQQRKVGNKFWQPILNFTLRTANFDWSTSIANYNLSARYASQRAMHAFLPWPVYLFHRHQGNRDALRIHLSDGGMSENLGVWPLLRRHIKQIVVVDGAEDENYDLGDLCELHRQLGKMKSPAYIVFETEKLSHFATTCEAGEHYSPGKDPFGFRAGGNWPAPVIRAWVCKHRKGSTCNSDDVIANLFIIKAALNWQAHPQGGYTLNDTVSYNSSDKLSEAKCELPANPLETPSGYPCEVLAFIEANGSQHTIFPQHSTIRTSALSSPYIYGAYRELGRYYARAIRIDKSQGTATVSIDDLGWNDSRAP
jgi:hypothetical protein